ncbi:MAG TPA: LLM class flavin-dependent oxidoreductase [Candidatus Bathyarchaeia archaeon]|nr:LLM class flavin-dependent oxidoreductase [Candidatus Bathyarchaeia archaeon]
MVREEKSTKTNFGLFFDPCGDLDFSLKVTKEAERLGFDSILFPDHYMSPWTNVKFDSWSLISYLAGQVDKIRLGTCVTPIPLRHPSVLAKIVATADILSRGRVILGVGAGWVKDEFVAYGIGWNGHKTRIEKTKEGIELILELWTGEEKIDYQGKHFNLKGAIFLPKPVQKPHPPLWFGGTSSKILEMVSAYGQGWIPYVMSAEDFGKSVKSIKNMIPDQKRREGLTYAYCGPTIISKSSSELDVLIPPNKKEKADTLWIAGDPKTCVKRVKDYLDNGSNYFVPIFTAREKTLESLELFADEVMPSFT